MPTVGIDTNEGHDMKKDIETRIREIQAEVAAIDEFAEGSIASSRKSYRLKDGTVRLASPQPLLLNPPASRISMIIHHQLLPLQKLHIMLSSLLFDPMGNSKIYYSFGPKGVHVQQHDIAWQNI